ncbi:MAG: TonB-dependent receptor, partial [Pseudomonadota bacterium]|nr:TonB-dependent receptor [Pseudomonadota bacterium]
AAGAQPAPPAEKKAEVADPNEIVVTATRQSEALSKVPISISAFSQKTLDNKGIKSFADVARFTPGVRFDEGSNNISIRGISSEAGAGTTGIYIDDTPIQIRGLGFNSDNSLPAIFDLDRIEVLRGPQGTLFGAGSEGGTIRYITPQPSLTEFRTYDRAEISSTAHGALSYEVGAAAGGPIIADKLGIRVSAWHRRDGGFIDHVDNQSGRVDDKNINHGDVTVLRGALAWEPVADLRITPSIQYQRRTTNASNNFFVGLSDPKNGVFRTSTPEYRGISDRFILPTLNVRYDFGGVALISNTSYFKRTNYSGYSGTLYDLSYYQSLCDGGCSVYPFLTPTGINPALPFYLSPSKVTNKQKIFTQEIRLQSNSPGSRLTWVAGLFYQHSKQRSIEELIDPLGNDFFNQVFGMSLEDFFGYPLYGKDSYINDSKAVEKQIAGFANVTYALTDQLKLTAGARYAKTNFSVTNFADGSQNGSRTEGAGKVSDRPFTPKLGINYQADPNNLFYASWARGFRAAGANPPVPVLPCQDSLDNLGIPSAPTTYKSDTVTSYELGAKNKFLDNRLTLDSSIYQVDWNNIQQIVNLPQCAIRFIANLGKARSRGFDLQANFRPTRNLTIDGSVGYTHTRYTQDARLAPGGAVVVNSGDAIEGAPWTLAIGAQYDFGLGGHNVFVRGDAEYKSRLKTPTSDRDPNSANYDPALIAPDSYTFVSMRAGVELGSANVSVFVDNLFDVAPQLGYTHQDANTLLFENATLRPRTVGLTLVYRR